MTCSRRIDRLDPEGDLHEQYMEWSKGFRLTEKQTGGPVSVVDNSSWCTERVPMEEDKLL